MTPSMGMVADCGSALECVRSYDQWLLSTVKRSHFTTLRFIRRYITPFAAKLHSYKSR